jgi:predicted Zn-dependent peptidase
MSNIKILQGVGLVFLVVLTAGGQKQLPPEGGSLKEFSRPATEFFELANGFSATLVSYGIFPKVAVQLVTRSGNLNEPANEVWLADLTAKLMKEGTKSRKAEDIAAATARMGGEITISAGMDLSFIGGDVLSEFGPELVRLIADIVQKPLFPETEIARLKNDLLRRLSIQMSQPQTLARAKFHKILYRDHPYGQVLSTPEIIQSFTAAKVRAFFKENFGAARSRLYVVGRFDAGEMKKTIRQAFGDWERGLRPLTYPATPESHRAVYFIDRPGSQQSTLYLGLPVIDPSHKDYLALQLTNILLGGIFTSRITSNIREDKGYTYTPYSLISAQFRDAYWCQFASVGNKVTAPALKEIFNENHPPKKNSKDFRII